MKNNQTVQTNVIEEEDCWRCRDCGAEWSFVMGDNEVPEICPYCKDDVSVVSSVEPEEGELFDSVNDFVVTTLDADYKEDSVRIRTA